MALTIAQSTEAYRLAAKGLGVDDICAALGIRSDAARDRIRSIVLHKPMPRARQVAWMEAARNRRNKQQQSVRAREEAADARRNAPITLPTLSILRNECGND